MEFFFADRSSKLYCVYLLISKNEKYTGRIYIGFTVNPNRRLKQHNKGVFYGGAVKTNNKGPWEMLLVVHGFPHQISALRFEWAWQNPHLSRRLKHIKRKTSGEFLLQYHLRVLDSMLQTGPWNRISLKVQWLVPSKMGLVTCNSYLAKVLYVAEFDVESSIKDANLIKKKKSTRDNHTILCYICRSEINNLNYLECLDLLCDKSFHVNCLANHFLEENEVIPVEGHCASCNLKMYWCQLISVNGLVL